MVGRRTIRMDPKWEYRCLAGPVGTHNNVFMLLLDDLTRIYTLAQLSDDKQRLVPPQ
jgi:hypothetical protein